jgi:hypothetical protein
MRYYLKVRKELKEKGTAYNASAGEIIETVLTQVESLWKKASIPTISHKRGKDILWSYHDKYRLLLKPYQSRKCTESYKRKIELFKTQSHKLFDVASCKCLVLPDCRCEKRFKVPHSEHEFLSDQRTSHKMYIGSVDKATTNTLAKREQRKLKDKSRCKQMEDSSFVNRCNRTIDDRRESADVDSSSISAEESECELYSSNQTPSLVLKVNEKKKSKHRIDLPTLAVTCDRYGISDRASAAIASAVLTDVGFISKEDRTRVIDRSKVRRERKRKREMLQLQAQNHTLRGLYFDGRKDNTMISKLEGKSYHRRMEPEEHYSIVAEPSSLYLGHITPPNSTAKGIEEALTGFLAEKKVVTDNFDVVGCDATVTNTGRLGGVIRLLEKRFCKPLQWAVCMLHINELPLRHLFMHLDGTTTGPQSFCGPIGKALKDVERQPVVKFAAIHSILPDMPSKDLSTDQRYLYEITTAVVEGRCPEGLSQRDPGKISHSRWLTTANRILRLYMSTEEPSQALKELTTFVVKVYAPVWFNIRNKPYFTCGSWHTWNMIRLSRYMSVELKTIIDPVIQRNAYYAHPENLLVGMISDESRYVRLLGYRRILKARATKHSEIRKFEIPRLDFDAESYMDLINWQDVKLTEPPAVVRLQTRDITEYF